MQELLDVNSNPLKQCKFTYLQFGNPRHSEDKVLFKQNGFVQGCVELVIYTYLTGVYGTSPSMGMIRLILL